MKIVHIAAHIGGGIGSAYVGLGSCGQEQSVLLLEPPIDKAALTKVEKAGFRILTDSNLSTAVRELQQADVVVFSWHHHPALTHFMHDFPAIPVRSILWCHVSGNYFPYIPGDFVKKFDEAIFAAPFSLELPQIRALGDEYLQNHCDVVYGLNDLGPFTRVQRKPHKQYTIGYVGTLGFCKLHPDFVEFCAAVNLPDVRFLMVGTPSAREQILESAARKGITGCFEFCGQLTDITKALAQMDVFGYLLNPQHFGATENALLEGMAAGLPVVALDQCVECKIIQDKRTGLLVHSPEEYGAAIRALRSNEEYAAQLGATAQADVLERYDIQANRKRFLAVCKRALESDKRIHHFDDFFTGQPADWFLSCVQEERDYFENDCAQNAGQIFHEHTKGSPMHYHTYFPEDTRLAQWVRQLEKSRVS